MNLYRIERTTRGNDALGAIHEDVKAAIVYAESALAARTMAAASLLDENVLNEEYYSCGGLTLGGTPKILYAAFFGESDE